MRGYLPALVAVLALPLGGCPVDTEGTAAVVAAPAEAHQEQNTHQAAAWSPPNGPMSPRGSYGAYTSVPVRLDVRPPTEPDAPTQEAVRAVAHVTFSGIAVCEACVGSLILRALPFQGPGQSQLTSPPGPLTAVKLPAAGPFQIAVPLGKDPVALELLIDTDEDGHPSRGERLAVAVGNGELLPDQDRAGFVLDGTEPMGGPWSGGAPPDQAAPVGGS